MSKKNIHITAAMLLAGIALADLFAGNTDHPFLPDVIANRLTQQIDMFLLLGAGALYFTA